MLIFDNFPSTEDAQRFAEMVWKEYRKKAYTFDNQDESDRVDPFPYELTPPIVLVERGSFDYEASIGESVKQFNGEFAGT